MLRVHVRVLFLTLVVAGSAGFGAADVLAEEPGAQASNAETPDAALIHFAEPALVALDESTPFDAQKSQNVAFEAGLNYRLWADGLLADEILENNGDQAFFQRLRANAKLNIGAFEAVFGGDVLTGRIAGDPYTQIPSNINAGAVPYGEVAADGENLLDPREIYGQWLSPVGQLRVGLQTSEWGLGVLANSGSTENEQLFGQTFGGDRSFRALFATAPLRPFSDSYVAQNTYLALGGDVVYRDENASYDRGDRAYQAVLSLFFQDAQTTVGGYMAYRAQTDLAQDELDILALDVYAARTWYDDGARWKFRTAAEAAFLTGSTTRAFSPDATPMNVLGLGVAGEFEIMHKPSELGLNLLLGYASGDVDASDDTLYRFRFDPNYKVGLVLFDHYMPAISRESFRRATDPEKSGHPPKGVEQLIETGSVANAYYLNPQLQFGQDMGLLAGVGALFARSDVAVSDPYDTLVNGGTPRGPRGRVEAGNDLGWELNAALQYRHRLVSNLVLEARAEYGILFPGSAFDDADGNPDDSQSLLRARFAVRW